jgi:RNA polymerase sigma-70 factor (ECF subfamily)
MTGDRAQAEELAQDTFIKAYRNLAAFDTTRRLSSWLFRIAHNVAIDELRRAKPVVVPLDPPDDDPGRSASEPASPAEPDPVERKALGRAIEAAMATLRPDFRAAIVLRYEEGLSFADVGHVLGIPEATARSHVHRARRELSERLAAAGWEPAR